MSVRKRGLALLMCICMIFTLLPFSVFAEDGAEGESTPTVADDKVMIKGSETVYDSLNAALAAVNDGDTVYLGNGTYSSYGCVAVKNTGYKLTFVGAGTDSTTWIVGKEIPREGYVGEYDGDYSFDGCNTVTFKNMTLEMGPKSYLGFIRVENFNVDSCVVNGQISYGGTKTASYTNTEFNEPKGTGLENHYIFFMCDPTDSLSFDNCEFNGSGEFINIYKDYIDGKYLDENNSLTVTINYANCTVNSSNVKNQPLYIKDDNSVSEAKIIGEDGTEETVACTINWVVNISGKNTVNYPDTVPNEKQVNENTCSRLFKVKGVANDYNLSGGQGNGKRCLTTVNIDGVTVWKDGKMVKHAVGTANDKYTDGYKDNAFNYSDRVVGNVTYKTKTCLYCGWSETKTEWDIDVSKSATALDTSTWTTDVTLSVPSTEQNLAADVVLALDVSKCSKKTLPAVKELLNDLAAEQKESGANIKVGIAMFKGSAVPFQELTTLTTEKNAELQALFDKFLSATGGDDAIEDAVRDYLKNTFTTDEYLNTGTNMPAGLLLAKEMLDNDTAVDADRKYMVLISDGSTYLFTHDNNYSTAWSRQHAPGSYQGGLYEINWRCKQFLMSNDATAEQWSTWLETIGEFSKTFTDAYDYQWKGASTPCENQIPSTETEFLVNSDTSVYQSATFYKQMQESGYNCYYCYAYDTEDYYGRNVLKTLNDDNHLVDASQTENIFADIEKAIIYAVGEGSTVTDEIGAGFTLVEGSLSVSVGDNELKSYTVKNDDGTWTAYFGDAEGESLKESARFTVGYKDGVLTWTFNEAASNFEPAQLSYTLKLVNPETAPGTYGQLDLNGDGKIDNTDTAVNAEKALYTNKSAVLKPVDSQGNECEDVVFPMPSVEYTVKPAPAPKTVLTITAGSAEGYGPDAITCDKWTAEGLKDGDTVASVTITGKQSVPGSSANVASGAVIRNAAGKDVTANYDIKYVDGTLTMIEILNKEVHFNYIIGYTDGTIRPDNNISRAEVATIFFRLLNDDVRDKVMTTDCDFSDVAEGSWCRRAIATLNSLGIIKGYNDGTFRPNAEITRAELATIISRFADLDVNTKTFSDISGHWAQKYIELAAGNGWINGYKDGTFRPDEKIIRAETFAMINRVLGRVTENVSDLLPQSDMNMWSDNMDEDAWYYKDVQEATNYHKCERVGDSVYEKWTEKVPDIDWAKYQL